MSGYAIFVYKGELHIAHGLDSAQQLAQRMTDAVVSGEATGVLVRSVDNSLPVVEGFQEAQFWTEIVKSIKTADYNAITRDTLAGMFGIVAGTLAIPLGPRAALLADYVASDAYKKAYDFITLGSQYIIGKMLEYFDNAETFFPEYDLEPAVNTIFLSARNVVIRYDPLVLDLDGDGLELVGANGNILFDHNADGIKTGTGWAGRDDGFLVRDLNGNGTIDTGRELFGVDTIKSDNTLATQGFDALKDLDSNADGQITSADAAYGELKIWQDINQDGISQSTELKTLAERGITSIGLNGTNTGPQAGQTINNNRVALSTTFTQNGQTKTVGAIDLDTNNFFTEFPTQLVDETGNPVEITEQALNLPQMNGAGMVRNMQAAASLDAAQTDKLYNHSIVSFNRAENPRWHSRPCKFATRSLHLEVRL